MLCLPPMPACRAPVRDEVPDRSCRICSMHLAIPFSELFTLLLVGVLRLRSRFVHCIVCSGRTMSTHSGPCRAPGMEYLHGGQLARLAPLPGRQAHAASRWRAARSNAGGVVPRIAWRVRLRACAVAIVDVPHGKRNGREELGRGGRGGASRRRECERVERRHAGIRWRDGRAGTACPVARDRLADDGRRGAREEVGATAFARSKGRLSAGPCLPCCLWPMGPTSGSR